MDHLQAAYLVDITDFIGTPEFKADRELATGVLSCFTDRPFFRLIECGFQRSGHPLFRNVYKVASGINKRMADGMECCIAS